VPGADPSALSSLPLFGSLSATELEEVAGWFEVREVSAGVQVMGEGATGLSFVVLADGEVAVAVDGREIARLRSGDFFGELGLLASGRRTATVTSTAPSRLLVMFGSEFTRLCSRYPTVAAELEAEAERRLSS
jgi:voltage-gated potassium channel